MSNTQGDFDSPPTSKELHHMVGELIKSTRMMKDDIRLEMQNTNATIDSLARTMHSFVENTAKQMDKIASQKDTTDRIERRLDKMEAGSISRHDAIDTRLRTVEECCKTNTSFIEIQKNKISNNMPTTIAVISAIIALIALVSKGSGAT